MGTQPSSLVRRAIVNNNRFQILISNGGWTQSLLFNPVKPTKVHLVKAIVFPVVMYGCESWTVKKAEHRRIDAFELWCWRILESPLDCKEIQPVHSEGDQPWDFFGRNDAKAETPVLWPPHAKS